MVAQVMFLDYSNESKMATCDLQVSSENEGGMY